jgi:hypothetical protein
MNNHKYSIKILGAFVNKQLDKVTQKKIEASMQKSEILRTQVEMLSTYKKKGKLEKYLKHIQEMELGNARNSFTDTTILQKQDKTKKRISEDDIAFAKKMLLKKKNNTILPEENLKLTFLLNQEIIAEHLNEEIKEAEKAGETNVKKILFPYSRRLRLKQIIISACAVASILFILYVSIDFGSSKPRNEAKSLKTSEEKELLSAGNVEKLGNETKPLETAEEKQPLIAIYQEIYFQLDDLIADLGITSSPDMYRKLFSGQLEICMREESHRSISPTKNIDNIHIEEYQCLGVVQSIRMLENQKKSKPSTLFIIEAVQLKDSINNIEYRIYTNHQYNSDPNITIVSVRNKPIIKTNNLGYTATKVFLRYYNQTIIN